MQVDYKRNLQNNYLVIEAEEDPAEDYCLHMAENNQIPGLLSLHSTRTDGRLYIQYEITSRQSMNQMYEKKVFSGKQLGGILTEIYDLLETMQEYLLNPAQIMFDPQYIYISAEDRTLQFCYLPGKEQKETIQTLAEFILKHLDHEDLQAVEMGYLFYQCVQEENFSLKQTLRKLLHRNKSAVSDSEYADMESKRKGQEIQKEYVQPEYEERTEYREQDPNHQSYEKKNMEWNETYNDMYDVYKIIHKERKKEHEKSRIDLLFQFIHPVVLISSLLLLAAIEILYYFCMISLTEAGGMFFLLISVEILGNQLWKKRKHKKEEQEFRWISEEEDAMYRILQEEMYGEGYIEQKNGERFMEGDRQTGKKKKQSYGYEQTEIIKDQDPGETRYLGEQQQESELHLIPVAGKGFGNRKSVHPEIVMRNEPLLIGKRKGESDIILDSPTVSRTHAMLECKGGMFYLCDLNSKNGTFCNGERLMPQEKRSIAQDDLIAFAELEYRAAVYSSLDSA